jgi:hypothetical protein
MNKDEIKKLTSVHLVIEEMIRHQPGITSLKLWDVCKDWNHKLVAYDFDAALSSLRGRFRCTNKQWYPPGHVAPPKVHSGPKPDPRQTRMDW